MFRRMWNGFLRHWRHDLLLGLWLTAGIYGFDVLRYGLQPAHPVLHFGTPAWEYYSMVFIVGVFFAGPWQRYCDNGPIGCYSRKVAADIQARRVKER